MANILKNDIRTYVRALISEEFEFDENKEKGISNTRTVSTGEHRDWEKGSDAMNHHRKNSLRFGE